MNVLSTFQTSDFKIWHILLQIIIVCILLLIANVLRRKIPFLRKMLFPTAIIAGFLGLGIKYLFSDYVLGLKIFYNVYENGVVANQMAVPLLQNEFLETITYHAIAIGFIALALKTVPKAQKEAKDGRAIKTGLAIVNTYLLQGILGMIITIMLGSIFVNAFSSVPEYAGILLPLGYGQGPGQAGNTGGVFEDAGFVGGKAYGLMIATMGFVWACTGGVYYINKRVRERKIQRFIEQKNEVLTTTEIEKKDEIPLSEAIDKLTIQICLVLLVYGIAFLAMWGLTSLIPADMIDSLIWGFNFIFAMLFAMVVKQILNLLQKKKIMKRKYTNEYMLNRISGVAFDFMIICSIMAIEVEAFDGWAPWVSILIICAAGGIATYFYLKYVCKKVYPNYEHEAFASLFGNLTGTASTGIALLREIDPNFETPAADNLVSGSSTAIMFGAPIFLILSFVYLDGWYYLWGSFAILVVLFVVFNYFMLFFKRKRKNIDTKKVES